MREKEFKKIKKMIKKFYKFGDCGLFNTRNIAGDEMETLFKGNYFQLDICYFWAYFEVFGTTSDEMNELFNLYNKLGE